MERKQQYFFVAAVLANRACHFEASHAGHIYVEKNYIWLERLREFDGLFAVVRFAGNRPVRYVRQESPDSATNESVVIHDENAGNSPSSGPNPRELGTIAAAPGRAEAMLR